MIGHSLVKQSGLYLVAQTFQKATSFLLIPVWTYYLLPADYGILGTMGAYSNLLHLGLMMGIYGAVIRRYYESETDPEELKSYVFSNFLFLAVVSGAILLLLGTLGSHCWNRISSGAIPFHPFAILTLVIIWAGLLWRMPLSLYQAQQRAAAFVIMEGVLFILSVALGLSLVAGYHMGAYGQLLGAAIAQGLMAIIATGLLFREWFTLRLAWPHVRSALAFGLPLVPHLLSAWALTFVDRIMLEHYVSLTDAGYYNLGYNLGMGMLVLVTSINQAYQPYYYGLMSTTPDAEKKILKIVAGYLAAVGLITLAGSLFAGELISILTPPRYQNAAVFVPPILLSYLLVGLYYFVGSPLFYFKRTKLLPFITGGAAVFNIILNYFLIPRYGAIAAAWTTLASYGAMLAAYYVAVQRISRVNYPIARYTVVLAILLAVTLFVAPTFHISPVSLLLKLAGCGFFAALSYLLLLKPQFSVSKAPRAA